MAPRRPRAAVALVFVAVFGTVLRGCDAAETRTEMRASEDGALRRLLASSHSYLVRDDVPLYANKVGPFHNPSEVRRGRGVGAFSVARARTR